jgi:uncharacterized protein
MSTFTPLPSLIGGLLIGAAASLLLWGTRRKAGVSGIAAGLLSPRPGDSAWRLLFLGGLVAGGFGLMAWAPGTIIAPHASLAVLAVAGGLVGFGTRLGGGCTSGHGICGLSRLSGRSLTAVMVFMATAALVVAVARWVGLS